jgi:drug/metabolite transporter (DMT)-like permease
VKPYIALVAICFIWGTTYLAIRIGIREFPPFLFSGLRFVIAGAVICIYYFAKGTKIPPAKDLKNLLISGIAISIGGNLLLCIAEKNVPSGIAAIVNSGFPFWIVIFSRMLMPEEKITSTLITGLFIGFTGQVLIFYDQLKFLAVPAYLTGIILVFIAVMCGAFGSVFMKKHTVHANPVFGGGIQMLCAGGISALTGAVIGEKIPAAASTETWMSFIYLIIFGSIIAYSCFCYALSVLPATLVTIYCYVNPIVAIILGYFILSEPITWKVIAAMVITIAGVYIIKRGSIVKEIKN